MHVADAVVEEVEVDQLGQGAEAVGGEAHQAVVVQAEVLQLVEPGDRAARHPLDLVVVEV